MRRACSSDPGELRPQSATTARLRSQAPRLRCARFGAVVTAMGPIAGRALRAIKPGRFARRPLAGDRGDVALRRAEVGHAVAWWERSDPVFPSAARRPDDRPGGPDDSPGSERQRANGAFAGEARVVGDNPGRSSPGYPTPRVDSMKLAGAGRLSDRVGARARHRSKRSIPARRAPHVTPVTGDTGGAPPDLPLRSMRMPGPGQPDGATRPTHAGATRPPSDRAARVRFRRALALMAMTLVLPGQRAARVRQHGAWGGPRCGSGSRC